MLLFIEVCMHFIIYREFAACKFIFVCSCVCVCVPPEAFRKVTHVHPDRLQDGFGRDRRFLNYVFLRSSFWITWKICQIPLLV